jgi:hypothetical protein
MPQIARIVPIAAALYLALGAAPASAVSALFDFDDFPSYVGPESGPTWTGPYTTDYSCAGQGYCTGQQVSGLNSDLGPTSVSAVRNGIGMEIGRPGAFSINFSDSHKIDNGNGPEDFDLFFADFDTPLHQFAADIEQPYVLGQHEIEDSDPPVFEEIYDILRVYLWSGPDGTGDLVGSFSLTPYEPFDVTGGRFVHVALTTDQPFQSADFGHALFSEPDCIDTNCGRAGAWAIEYQVDNVFVSTIPEPGTALLLAFGLVAVGARVRRY